MSITPFGQTGPYSAYKGGDLVAQAVGGFLYTTGESDRAPMGTALEQTHVAAARNAAIAVMGAILQREFTGEGQHIDVSIMEAVVSTPPSFIHQYSYTGAIAGRGFGEGNVMDGMHLPTADSDVTLTTAGTGGNPMQTWADFLDEPRLLDSKFATPRGRTEHAADLLELVQSKLRRRKGPRVHDGRNGPPPGRGRGAEPGGGRGVPAPRRARHVRRHRPSARRRSPLSRPRLPD